MKLSLGRKNVSAGTNIRQRVSLPHLPLAGTLLGAGLLLASCGAEPPDSVAEAPETSAEEAEAAADLQPIVVGTAGQVIMYAPLWIADDQGYFTDEGLEYDPVIIRSGGELAAGLIGGSLDVAATGVSHIIRAVEENQQIRAIAPLNLEQSAMVVIRASILEEQGIPADAPFKELASTLDGLTIGVSGLGSSTHQMVNYVAQIAGVEADSFDVVPLGEEAMLEAFAQGLIDGFARSSPGPEIAVQSHDAVYLANPLSGGVPGIEGTANQMLVVRLETMEDDREKYLAFARAIYKAQRLIAERPEDAREIVRVHMGGDGENMEPEVFDLAWENNLPSLGQDGLIGPDNIEAAIRYFEATSDESVGLAFEDIVEPSLMDEAIDQVESDGWQP